MNNIPYKRRSFLQLAGFGSVGLFLPLSWQNNADNLQNNTNLMVYIGTYTNGKSEGIYLYKLDATTGELTQVSVTPVKDIPSFLTLDPQ